MFTFNDWSSGTEYEHMAKAAVLSAVDPGRMKPFCMYSGSASSDMYHWLLSMNVTMIMVSGVWACGWALWVGGVLLSARARAGTAKGL